jgi:hypothetical protein
MSLQQRMPCVSERMLLRSEKGSWTLLLLLLLVFKGLLKDM